ncbi:MAG: hypothetical protein ABJG68_14630 [Crocinitomicaceae bacterium]
MKRLIPFTLVALIAAFSSCSGDGEPADNNDQVDTLNTDTLVDTTLVDSTLFMDDSGYVNEEAEIENLIEATYGEQWDFCDCVVKNDSVNKAIETAGDDEFDAILARMEVIDNHCKAMLATPNTTPDEREAHERKVRKCLRDAK